MNVDDNVPAPIPDTSKDEEFARALQEELVSWNTKLKVINLHKYVYQDDIPAAVAVQKEDAFEPAKSSRKHACKGTK